MEIAKCMNNSWGIAMNPAIRTRRNRDEVRLEWIGDNSIRAGIKLKYLQKFPNIYIHRLECAPRWTELAILFRLLTKQNGQKNVILSQFQAFNYRINSEDLAFPVYTVFVRLRRMDWNNRTQIMEFLRCELTYLPPNTFEKITDKLFSCKQFRSARKKILPTLIAMHKEQNERYADEQKAIYNQSYFRVLAQKKNASKTIRKMEKLLNDPKTRREYQAFFETMEKVFVAICIHQIREIMQITRPHQPVLETEVRVEDLITAYSNTNGTGDLHVLCTRDVDWDYPLIRNKLLMFLHIHETNFEYKNAIAQAVVKEVIHFDEVYHGLIYVDNE